MARKVEVFEVAPRPGDYIWIRGAVDGTPVETMGWASAVEYHYAPEDYDADGSIREGRKPREMTSDELRAYCEGLLLERAPVAVELPPLPALAGLKLDPEPGTESVAELVEYVEVPIADYDALVANQKQPTHVRIEATAYAALRENEATAPAETEE